MKFIKLTLTTFVFLLLFLFGQTEKVHAQAVCAGSGSSMHMQASCATNYDGTKYCQYTPITWNYSCSYTRFGCCGPSEDFDTGCDIPPDASTCRIATGEIDECPSTGCYTYNPTVPTNTPGPTATPGGPTSTPPPWNPLPEMKFLTLVGIYIDTSGNGIWDAGEPWVLPSVLQETKKHSDPPNAEEINTCNLNAGCTGVTGRSLTANGMGMAGLALKSRFPDASGTGYNIASEGQTVYLSAQFVQTAAVWNNFLMISGDSGKDINKYSNNSDNCDIGCWEKSQGFLGIYNDKMVISSHPWDYVGRSRMCTGSVNLPDKNMRGSINEASYDSLFTPLVWPINCCNGTGGGCSTTPHFVCNAYGRGTCFNGGQVKAPFIMFYREYQGLTQDRVRQEYTVIPPAGYTGSTRIIGGSDRAAQFIAVGIKPAPLQCTVNPSLATGFTQIADISGRKAYQYVSNGSPGTIGVAGYQNGNLLSSNLNLNYTKLNTQAWGTPAPTPQVFTPQRNFFGAGVVNGGYSSSAKSAEITLGSSGGRVGGIYQGRVAADTPRLNDRNNFAGKQIIYGGCYKTALGTTLSLQLARKYGNDWHGYWWQALTGLQSPTPSTWQCASQSVFVPANTQALDLSAIAVGTNPIGAGEKVFVDNLFIAQDFGLGGQGPNLLTNPGFETGALTPWNAWDGAGAPSSNFASTFDPSGILPADVGDYDVVCNNYLPSNPAIRCTGNPIVPVPAGWQDCGTSSRIVVRVAPPSILGQLNVTFFNGKSLSDCTPGGSGTLSGTATVNTVAQTNCTVPPATSCSATQSIDVAAGGTINSLYVNPTPVNNTTYLTTLPALPANWLQCDPRTGGKPTTLNSVTTSGNVQFGITQNVGSWYQTLGGNVHGQTGNQTWSVPKSVVPPNPLNFFNISDPTRSIGLVSAHGTLTCSDSMGGADTSCHSGATDWRSAAAYSITSDATANPATYGHFDSLFTSKDSSWTGDLDNSGFFTSHGSGGIFQFSASGFSVPNGGITVPAGQKYIIFTTGNVTISGNITLGNGAFLAIFTNGTITVDPSATTIAGIFLSTNEFTTTGSNDTPLTVNGTVIANAVTNNRTFVTSALSQSTPTVQFAFNPLLIVNAPDSLKRDASFSWKEVTR